MATVLGDLKIQPASQLISVPSPIHTD